MQLERHLRRGTAGAALALLLSIPAMAGDWTDPGGALAADGDLVSGSARTLPDGSVDLRVELGGPPAAPNLKTYWIEWFLDLDEDTGTCASACSALAGADVAIVVSNTLISPDKWYVRVITPVPNEAPHVEDLGCSPASFNTQSNTLRLVIDGEYLTDASPGFRYAVLSTCGGGTCNDRAPDAETLQQNPTSSYASQAAETAEFFSGVTLCGFPPAPPPPSTPPELISTLADLVNGFDLVQGVETTLDSKLDLALAALDAARANSATVATNQLQAFINEVQAQRGKKLTTAQADALIALAQQIIAKLAGG